MVADAAAARVADAVPTAVHELMGTLRAAGHTVFVVGGSVRDVLIGREPIDWDLATDARPDRMLALLPGAVYENAFGTVAVRREGRPYELTTFRSDHEYADFRRPHRVEFGEALEDDLARRDFTVNAMAWGYRRGAADPALLDPHGGRTDAAGRILRAVGDPGARFSEDALRMLRAIRLATTLEFEIEPATLAAIHRHAGLAVHLSGERIAGELDRLLAAPRPSRGLRLLEETGLLGALIPELAAQRGVPQNKTPGEDLWDHTLRTVDAAPADRPVLRLAALLHDVAKPETLAHGRFLGHDAIGADRAQEILRRLRYPKPVVERVAQLVRQHMFSSDPAASDAAIRRFIARIGRPALDELLDLRAADNVGSGREAGAGGLAELRRRVAEQLEAEVALDRGDLAIDGNDLIAELGLAPGPRLGRVLDELLDRVLADPTLNDRPTLVLLARGLSAEDGS